MLAYSGGLDTSTILRWLIEEGYEVVTFMADIGQPAEDTNAITEKAKNIGAVSCHVWDVKRTFVDDYIFPCIRANAIYERRYLLGTSVARPCITEAMVKIAHEENCGVLSHVATGKGNDQVRFELQAAYLDPSMKVIAPWRDPNFYNKFEGRQDLIDYAESRGIPVAQTKAKSYSSDENLLHISYESGILEDPMKSPDDDMFQMTVSPMDAPDTPEDITVDFKAGNPVAVTKPDGQKVTGSLELFEYLNQIGGKHAIGRLDIVENRFVGIKSRGVYETPGGKILFDAHTDLETLCLDREVMKIRDELSIKFAELCYNGFWFSPEMDYVRSCVDLTQGNVNGQVRVQLYKGNVIIKGRETPTGLYDMDIASMDVAGDYNPSDAEGFIKINAVRLKAAKNLEKRLESAGFPG